MLENFLTAIQTRDLDRILALYADEVDWNVPGDTVHVPWSGKRKSRAEIRQFYELLWESTTPVSAQVNLTLPQGNDVVIVGAFQSIMRKTGRHVGSLFCIHMTITGGEIIKYSLLEDSYAVAEAMKS